MAFGTVGDFGLATAPNTYGASFGSTPTGGWGAFGGGGGYLPAAPGWEGALLDTFEGDPQRAWETARLAEMGSYAANPLFQRTASFGFAPALGRYLAAGGRVGTGADAEGVSFADWLGRTVKTPASDQPYGLPGHVPATESRVADQPVNLADAYSVSKALGTQGGLAGMGTLNPTQAAISGFLSGDNARRNQLAMLAAQTNLGVGLGARSAQRALGNLYDLYAARQSTQGLGGGGFLNYMRNLGYAA
jgi:hypothetical protein